MKKSEKGPVAGPFSLSLPTFGRGPPEADPRGDGDFAADPRNKSRTNETKGNLTFHHDTTRLPVPLLVK